MGNLCLPYEQQPSGMRPLNSFSLWGKGERKKMLWYQLKWARKCNVKRKHLGFPSSWSIPCYEKRQRGVKAFPYAFSAIAGFHIVIDLLVTWVKNNCDLVIPKAAVSFSIESELVSENKLAIPICYILPSPKTRAQVWNDWVN